MKKSLIALAVLAASGAAMAQSSVTLSGNINLGVMKQDIQVGNAAVSQSAKIDTGGGSFSQIAFRGTEDLGGGLKANFTLAQRLSPESGGNDGPTNGRPTFQGESTVGLSGNFGAVKIGRSLTAFQGPVNASDPWGLTTVAATNVLPSGYLTDPAGSTDGSGIARTDAITYASPVFAGFSAAASLGLKNSQAKLGGNPTVQQKNLGSIWLSYANGPIMIGGGYEKNRLGDDVAAILGSYDFGIAKLMAGYGQVDVATLSGTKGKNWNLGVAAPIGAFTVKAGYRQAKAEVSELKTKKFGIGGEYALSKRTYLYTGYGRTKADGKEALKGFDIGMVHAF